ncbi:Uncharacterised protein [Bifidobacterium bifidum]|nr:Uncharacterised protein [Bifidobacterium bifidum]
MKTPVTHLTRQARHDGIGARRLYFVSAYDVD